jgi:GT2 family glycosyltransferase
MSYKREVIERLGPQDETLFRGEDVDYNWRARRLGYRIYYDPTIRVIHHHRPTLRSFLQQYYMYGRAYYLVRRKWPDMYCAYPHGFHRPKDLAKALNFFAGVLYQPALLAGRLSSWPDRVLGYSVLLLNALTWRAGILRQAWLEWNNSQVHTI